MLVLAGLKAAVTPDGSPEIARLTVPEKPLAPAILTVLVEMDPAARETVTAEDERLKLGV